MLLDSKYSIQWDIDLENSRIYFQSIVETVGYVGFGLSSNGQMNGADIFIAGVVPINWTYAMVRNSFQIPTITIFIFGRICTE